MLNQRLLEETKSTASENYLVYVLPFTENITLAEYKESILQKLCASGGLEVNAVVLFPRGHSSSSTGSRSYNAWIIRNGRWVTIESQENNAVELINQYRLPEGFLTKQNSLDYFQLIHEAITTTNIKDIQAPSDVTYHLVVDTSMYDNDIHEMEKKKPIITPPILCKTIPILDQDIIKAANAKNTFVFFNRVPKVILEKYLLPCLGLTKDKKTTGLLGFVSKKPGTLFQEHSNPQVKALLQAVVYAQYDEVKRMLDEAAKNSLPLLEKLLTIPMEIVDYSGRHLYGNALQRALGAGDVSRPKFPNEGMAELIMGYYKKLPNGESLKQAHINEFAKHAEISPEQDEKDIGAVETVFNAIKDAKTSDEEETALQIFRNYLEPDPKNLIKGKDFNHNMLIRAYELYEKYYSQFGGWDSHKNNLAWRKVIGYLQRFLPACDGQVMAQGLWGVTETGEPLRRSLEFHYNPGIFVFPLPLGPSGLGYDHAARGLVAGGGVRAQAAGVLRGSGYETYVNKKTNTLRIILHSSRTSSIYALAR